MRYLSEGAASHGGWWPCRAIGEIQVAGDWGVALSLRIARDPTRVSP